MSYTQTILSAAKREDIITYFQNQIKSTSSSCHFSFPSGVTVDLLDSRPHPITPTIIHTPIIFFGAKEHVEKIITDFRRRFLTAGG
jgi:hypothetical protein